MAHRTIAEHDLNVLMHDILFGGALRGPLGLKTASDENWAAAIVLAVRAVLGDDLRDGAAVEVAATANALRRAMAVRGRGPALLGHLAKYRDEDGGAS